MAITIDGGKPIEGLTSVNGVGRLPTAGGVGSYAICMFASTSVSKGTSAEVAGSNLEWGGTFNGDIIDNMAYNFAMGSPAGTWRLMQQPFLTSGVSSSKPYAQYIFMRIV